ncbi:EscU/YscU/HrcU family type III secretion system export apparatus switch protein [Caenimonas koreensis DSM 17982]|uniref:EscU/YscU/HrcU family type III secretion system export apparatus switch protein n=1 Tax=Caenimonas koreensis DSM 17982 TaxID=1121255 RepID=A0A844AS12_9BURK|nr:type III secretion system export apparatus subunit SctU [Caenimonas koreensis]MRD47075.1 EscU/YscU/HrcU family type III secretion system export apparatus switch protein [Caenimonas koreensis DSM 17982]
MSEKTERPTDHRIRKAREDGQVAKSKDFTQALLIGALFGYTLVMAGDIFKTMGEMVALPGQLYGMDFKDAVAISLSTLWRKAAELLVPYLLIVIVIGVFGETIQTGLLLSFKALLPKGDKLNPIANLKQMFTMKNLVEFIKSCLKVTFLMFLVYFVVRDSLDTMIKIPLAGIGAAGLALGEMMRVLTINTFICFAVIAVFDLAWQRYSYIKGLMMSMEEIKQEYKQMEGDPHMKGHRKELAREIAMGEMVANTRKASVVVTNPTHVAVGLFYEESKTPLPVVVCKGEGGIAEAIKRVAEQEGIPVLQNVPLARALLSQAQVAQYIPSELIEPVAELLLAMRKLTEKIDEHEDDFNG